MTLTRPRLARAAMAATASAMILTACGGGGGSGDGAKELTLQNLSGPDTPVGRAAAGFAEAVEKYSEGRITIEVAYNGSIVGSSEMVDGLSSGIVDIGNVLPQYEPEKFPLANAIIGLEYEVDQSPQAKYVALLGAYGEQGFTPEFLAEQRAAGIEPLAPLGQVNPVTSIACSGAAVSTPDSARGLRARNVGAAATSILEDLGMTGVSVPVNEAYEAMERGVLDCDIASPSSASAFGTAELVDHWTIDAEVSLPSTFGSWSISSDVWEELSEEDRAAIDRATAEYLVGDLLTGQFTTEVNVLESTLDAGGTIESFDAEAREVITSHNTEIRAASEQLVEEAGVEDPEAWVQGYLDKITKWNGIAQELGYADEYPTWQDAVEAGAEFDPAPVVEKYLNDVLPLRSES